MGVTINNSHSQAITREVIDLTDNLEDDDGDNDLIATEFKPSRLDDSDSDTSLPSAEELIRTLKQESKRSSVKSEILSTTSRFKKDKGKSIAYVFLSQILDYFY